MSSQNQTVNQGTVEFGGAAFVVQELPLEAEMGLRVVMRTKAREALGPGSFYKNILPAVKFARDMGEHQDANQMVASVAPLIATGVGASEDAADMWRRTPDGVATELYYRTRATHPGTTEAEIRAVVNQVNALEVHIQILRAIDPKVPATPGN